MKEKGLNLKCKKITFDAPSKNAFRSDEGNEIFRQSPICGGCLHYIIANLFNKSHKFEKKCEAFPKGIPDEIWGGENNHTEPYDDDKGIRFTKPTRDRIIETLKKYIKTKGVSTEYAKRLLDTLENQSAAPSTA